MYQQKLNQSLDFNTASQECFGLEPLILISEWKKPVEVVPYKDASWLAPATAVSNTYHWMETPRQRQALLDRSHGWPGNPLEELE